MNTTEIELLTAYKRALFATSREEHLPTGDGMFCGMKVKVVTLPLPSGIIGMMGYPDRPEEAIFISCNTPAPDQHNQHP